MHLTLSKFYRWNSFPDFFLYPCRYCADFLACKSITSVLKSSIHISYILKDDQIPSFTSKRILYLKEYMQPVGNLVLPCNTFRMLVDYIDKWKQTVKTNKHCFLWFEIVHVAKNTLFIQMLVDLFIRLKHLAWASIKTWAFNIKISLNQSTFLS